jgi:hypothetical protein
VIQEEKEDMLQVRNDPKQGNRTERFWTFLLRAWNT